jgi:hypothetical protein
VSHGFAQPEPTAGAGSAGADDGEGVAVLGDPRVSMAGELGVAGVGSRPSGPTGTMTSGESEDGLTAGAETETLRLPLLL